MIFSNNATHSTICYSEHFLYLCWAMNDVEAVSEISCLCPRPQIRREIACWQSKVLTLRLGPAITLFSSSSSTRETENIWCARTRSATQARPLPSWRLCTHQMWNLGRYLLRHVSNVRRWSEIESTINTSRRHFLTLRLGFDKNLHYWGGFEDLFLPNCPPVKENVR